MIIIVFSTILNFSPVWLKKNKNYFYYYYYFLLIIRHILCIVMDKSDEIIYFWEKQLVSLIAITLRIFLLFYITCKYREIFYKKQCKWYSRVLTSATSIFTDEAASADLLFITLIFVSKVLKIHYWTYGTSEYYPLWVSTWSYGT